MFHLYCILRAHIRAGSPAFESNCHVLCDNKMLFIHSFIQLKFTASQMFRVVSGDIGGFLGLLIGGSALTIIEVVDLVFYNAFLRFIGKA